MPRILIADDNSNIQRMAALALKDAGIEVVAVGNGEAAVRKMPEVLPDLVLADIFMPVRNGYEVCEFVKHDPKYSNTPVLLLAGAFDPFDEQEAQRVQADGILKKPFVPPDPLINAVRTLLAKSAGERLMAVTVPAAAEASAESSQTASASSETPPAVAPAAESPNEAEPQPLSVVDFARSEKKGKPSNFMSSLEFPVTESDEAESPVTASRDPILGEPAFWVPAEDPAETAPEPTEDFTDHTWSGSGHPVPMRDDPPLMIELEPPAPAKHEVHAEPEPSVHEITHQEIASITPVHETALAPRASAEDTLPLPETLVESAPVEMAPVQGSTFGKLEAAVLPPPEIMPTPEITKTFASGSELDQTVTAAGEPTETDDTPLLELAESALSFPDLSEPVNAALEPQPAVTEHEEAAQEHPAEAEFAVEWPPVFVPLSAADEPQIQTPPLEIAPARPAPVAAEPETTAVQAPAASMSPEAVEALIQRVIDRMQPQIVEIVSRQILRPLVESLVRHELDR